MIRSLLSAATAMMLVLAPSAYAQTFQAEAVEAVTSNPGLAAERARLRAVRQALPLAWSELLPQVTVDASAIEQDSSEESIPFTVRQQPEYWIASVRASTLLFGSGRVAASTRLARAQIASAVALYQSAVQDFALEFTAAYTNVIFAREVLAAQEESLANLEEQARFANANQREGFLTRTDVAQAEARVALARAELARAQAQVIEATEIYNRIVGHMPGELETPPGLVGLPASLQLALDTAADEHPALIAAAADIRAADAAVDAAAANGRLRLYLESTNSTFDAISTQEFTQQFESTVGVRVAVPLFTGGAVRSRTAQQRNLRDATQFQAVDVERRVRERVNTAWSALVAARARLDASDSRLVAAELASRGVRREQQFGQRSMIDVLNQEQERLNARVSRAEAERDVAIAERQLAAAVGMISPLIGVESVAQPRRERVRNPIVEDDEEW